MSLDSVFQGPPTLQDAVYGSGNASLGIDQTSGKLYWKTLATPWQECAGSGGTSDDILNESEVAGATVTDALNNLQGGGGGGEQSVTVMLTADQMNSLAETPVQLLAAPATGSFYLVTKVNFLYKYGSQPFDGSFASLYVNVGTTPQASAGSLVGFIDQTSDQSTFTFADGFQGAVSSVDAQNINISNSGSDTTGGTGSTLVVTVWYVTITND